MLAMEKDFDSKLMIQGTNNNNNNNSSNDGASKNVQISKSFAFRAPQENFSIQDFELGKIYGVGSYSKVSFLKFQGFYLYILDFWHLGLLLFLMFDYFIYACLAL